MTTIPLSEALALFDDAKAVLVGALYSYVCFHSTEPDEDNPNLFLSVSPDDNEGSVAWSGHSQQFALSDNEGVRVEGASLLLVSTKAEIVRLTPLFARDVETHPARVVAV